MALSIFTLPGSNALNTAEKVYAKMRELKTRFPEGIDYRIVYNTTPFISESIDDVLCHAARRHVLVAIVVLVFLQNWRATLIPLIAVPVALIGTFASWPPWVFRSTTCRCSAWCWPSASWWTTPSSSWRTWSAGWSKGVEPREAARRAMDEVTGPVIAVALVLCAVFVPCTFLGGISGQFFRQFAVTISVSTVISAFNSLTLSPALAALLLKPHGARPRSADPAAEPGARLVLSRFQLALRGRHRPLRARRGRPAPGRA